MAAMTRPAADGLRSASQAWMAARSARALREKRTSATVTGEELPNRCSGAGSNGSSCRRFSSASSSSVKSGGAAWLATQAAIRSASRS